MSLQQVGVTRAQALYSVVNSDFSNREGARCWRLGGIRVTLK